MVSSALSWLSSRSGWYEWWYGFAHTIDLIRIWSRDQEPNSIGCANLDASFVVGARKMRLFPSWSAISLYLRPNDRVYDNRSKTISTNLRLCVNPMMPIKWQPCITCGFFHVQFDRDLDHLLLVMHVLTIDPFGAASESNNHRPKAICGIFSCTEIHIKFWSEIYDETAENKTHNPFDNSIHTVQTTSVHSVHTTMCTM